MMTRLLYLTLLLLLPTASTVATTYRWVDDKGVVNYAERKPRGVPESRITAIDDGPKSRSSSPASPVTAPITATGTSSNGPGINVDVSELEGLQAQSRNQQLQLAEARRINCENSKQTLEQLTIRPQVRVQQADGSFVAISEEERQERILQAQEGINENC